mmetsp:Transcript_100638/g.282004  ORF Transcript_100638/g.282004 Transcript_100638/m.282004 type:complete len:178 (+) Transcript_100638:657-1190(+)
MSRGQPQRRSSLNPRRGAKQQLACFASKPPALQAEVLLPSLARAMRVDAVVTSVGTVALPLAMQGLCFCLTQLGQSKRCMYRTRRPEPCIAEHSVSNVGRSDSGARSEDRRDFDPGRDARRLLQCISSNVGAAHVGAVTRSAAMEGAPLGDAAPSPSSSCGASAHQALLGGGKALLP